MFKMLVGLALLICFLISIWVAFVVTPASVLVSEVIFYLMLLLFSWTPNPPEGE